MSRSRDSPFAVAFLLALVALGQVYWAYNSDFQMAWMYEFSHYGDIARSMSQGGYHSSFLFPTELAVLDETAFSNPPWPVTYRFPLFAAWIALFFKVLGPSDPSLVVATGSAWAIFVALVYAVGRRVFSTRVGLGAAVVTLLTPVLFREFALWGYADILFGVMLLLHHYALPNAPPRRMVLVGVLGGFCYLARFNFVLFTPVVAVFLLLRKRSWPSLGYFAGFALPVLAYRATRPDVAAELQQTTILAGNLSQIGQHIPWLDYVPPPEIPQLLAQRFGALMEKGVFNLSQELEWFTRPYGHFLYLPLAVAGAYLVAFRGRGSDLTRDWVGLYAGCGLVQIATFSFLRVEPLGRYWVWALPCFLLLAGLALDVATDGLSRSKRNGLVAGLAVLTAFWLITQLRYTIVSTALPVWASSPPPRVEFRRLAELVPENGLIVSNVAVHAAWYAERPAVDLPNSVEDLERILARHDVKAVFIVNWPQGELYNRSEWKALTETPGWDTTLAARLKARSHEAVRGGVIFLL